MEKIEKRLDDLSQYVQHSLTFVEAKHGAFIALCLVLLSVIIENCMEVASLCEYILTTATLVFLICSLCTSLWAFYPVKKGGNANPFVKPTDSIFRCENIESLSSQQLMQKLSEGVEEYEFDSFQREKVNNIIAVSKAASRKYRLFRTALKIFAVFICLFVVMLILKFTR